MDKAHNVSGLHLYPLDMEQCAAFAPILLLNVRRYSSKFMAVRACRMYKGILKDIQSNISHRDGLTNHI